MEKMKVAVIGYGGMGGWHTDHLLNSDVAELAGVYDKSHAWEGIWALQGQDPQARHGMRYHDQRPPLRGAVHTESGRQTHIQKRIRQDTRGMRRKARRVDKDDESRNCGDEKASEERITHRGGDRDGRPSKFASEEAKKSQIGWKVHRNMI